MWSNCVMCDDNFGKLLLKANIQRLVDQTSLYEIQFVEVTIFQKGNATFDSKR